MVVAGQRCVRQLSGSAGHHYNFILYCLYCSCILRQKESEFWVKMSHLNTKQECCRFSCSQYILSPSKYSTHGICAKIFVSLDLSLKGSSLKVAILSILCLTSHKISTEILTLLLICGPFLLICLHFCRSCRDAASFCEHYFPRSFHSRSLHIGH